MPSASFTSAPAGDPFRRDYGTLTTDQKEAVSATKELYEQVWNQLLHLENLFGKSRDISVAKTELQTSCMWAVRACTKTGSQE